MSFYRLFRANDQIRIQGAIGAIALLKPVEVALFTMISYNSGNSILDRSPIFRPLFCHSSVVKLYARMLYTSSLLQCPL